MQFAVTTTWAGEELTLFAQRAMFWKRASTLFIADPHFGKAATFRSAGIPVPSGTTDADLNRLNALLEETGASRLVILGDFFHAAPGRAPEGPVIAALSRWREERRDLAIILVRGNHDLHAGDPPEAWNFEVADSRFPLAPFLLCHEPPDGELCEGSDAGLFSLAGHLHPAVRLRDVTGASVRLPCFHFGARAALLPAFGSFTGNAVIRPRPGDGVYVIASESEILAIPTRRAA